MSFLGEIKRRKVFQVVAVYLVVAWLIMQVVDVVSSPLLLPEWFPRVVILLLAMGLPVTVMLSWVFDVTFDGIVRESTSSWSLVQGSSINFVLLGLLIVSGIWIGFRELTLNETRQVLPNSIAVLPCENFSPSPENAYFAPGIHEEVLNQLVKIRDLNVIARTSVLQYAGVARPITEIAEELNVESVMECSVSYAEGRVAVAAQLIDAVTGIHLWSERYNREFLDVFDIQADIAEQVALALQAELLPSEQANIERPLSASTEAYDLFLKGITSVGNITPAGHGLSDDLHRYLDQAIALDPEFARAHAIKALDYAQSLFREFARSDPLTVAVRERLAEEFAHRALDLNPDLGVAYAAIGWVHKYNRRWEEATSAFERALELSPNDRDVLIDFSSFQATIGRHEDALLLGRRAAEVDPIYGAGWLGTLRWRSGNAEAAAIAYRSSQIEGEGDPNIFLCLAELARGRNEDALRTVRSHEEATQGDAGQLREIAYRAYVYGRLGRREDAQRQIAQVEAMSAETEVGEAIWAIIYLGLGDRDMALNWLEEASKNPRVVNGYYVLAAIANNWLGDPILGERDFVEVRGRLGFDV